MQRAHSSWVSTPGMEEFSSLTLAPWGNWIILIIQEIIIWNGTHPYEPCMHNSCKLNVIGLFLPFFPTCFLFLFPLLRIHPFVSYQLVRGHFVPLPCIPMFTILFSCVSPASYKGCVENNPFLTFPWGEYDGSSGTNTTTSEYISGNTFLYAGFHSVIF